MLVVTHEMGLCQRGGRPCHVPGTCDFVEEAPPRNFLQIPNQNVRSFLSKVL